MSIYLSQLAARRNDSKLQHQPPKNINVAVHMASHKVMAASGIDSLLLRSL